MMDNRQLQSWLGGTATLEKLAPEKQAGVGVALPEMGMFDRVQLRDRLFGAGYNLPGGEAELLRIMRPLHLTHDSRLLLVGSSTEGPARRLAELLGIATSGLDRDALQDGAVWDPSDAGELPSEAFHHAVALHPLRDEPPEIVLNQILHAIRPSGHLLLLEHVSTEAFDPMQPEEAQWLVDQSRTLAPPRNEDVLRGLTRLGVQLRGVDDLSHLHARLTVYGWRRLLQEMKPPPDLAVARLMLNEAGGWAMRERLFQQDKLRLILYNAVLPPVSSGPDALI